MSYTTIPAKQDGSSWNPYIVSGAPSASPGYAAAIHSTAFDSTNSVWYIKYGPLDTDWKPLTGAQSYPNDESYYKARARTLMGSPRLTCWWWSDLLEPSGEEFIATLSAGATWACKSNACGVGRLTVGKTASNEAGYIYIGNETASTGNNLPGGTSGVWYYGIRAKSSGGIDTSGYNNTWSPIIRSNGGHAGYVLIGQRNGAYFGVQYDMGLGGGAQVVTTSVLVDTSTHSHELYRIGGVTYYAIDEVIRASIADAYTPGPNRIEITASCTPAAAAATVLDIDWIATAVGGNNPRTIT